MCYLNSYHENKGYCHQQNNISNFAEKKEEIIDKNINK